MFRCFCLCIYMYCEYFPIIGATLLYYASIDAPVFGVYILSECIHKLYTPKKNFVSNCNLVFLEKKTTKKIWSYHVYTQNLYIHSKRLHINNVTGATFLHDSPTNANKKTERKTEVRLNLLWCVCNRSLTTLLVKRLRMMHRQITKKEKGKEKRKKCACFLCVCRYTKTKRICVLLSCICMLLLVCVLWKKRCSVNTSSLMVNCCYTTSTLASVFGLMCI